MYGSYFINNYLRFPNEMSKDKKLENMIDTLYKTITTSPKLDSEKVVFRFIHNDDFINHLNVGDIYEDNSFLSCTRKPNMSSKNYEFGLILLKIYLPANKGVVYQ